MGFVIGGLILMSFLMLSWRWVLRRWISGILLPIAATGAAFLTTILIGGLGMADGGPPQFLLAFINYLIPAIIVGVAGVVIFFVRSNKQ
jgi:hypothetical protein